MQASDVLSRTSVEQAPNTALYVFGDHNIYYGISGGTLRRIARSELA